MDATIPVTDSERNALGKLIAEVAIGKYMSLKATAEANREIGDNARADEFMEYARRDAPLCVTALVVHLGACNPVEYARITEAVKKLGESDGLEMSEEELKAAIADAIYEGWISEEGGFYKLKVR